MTPQQMAQRIAKLAELEQQLTFRIARLSKLLDNHASGKLEGSGLSLTWYRILMVLDIFEGTTAADLSRLMVIDRAQISRAIADLESQGMVARSPDETSKRKQHVSLTRKGKDALSSVRPAFRERHKALIGQLDNADMAGLTAALDKLSAYLAVELDMPEAMPTCSVKATKS